VEIGVWIHPSLEEIQRGDMAVSSGVGDLKRMNVVSIQRSIPRAEVGAMMI
jgi:hypothetical protein